jgi:hypothetical protein
MSSLRPRYAILLGAISLLGVGGGDDGSVGHCGHKAFPWSEPDCPSTDTLARFVAIEDMTSVQLEVRTKGGQRYVTKIAPGTDAIFLSQKSIDSILIPYYKGRGATREIDILRNRVARP